MSLPLARSTHIPVLDHLRGMAAFLVFVVHFDSLLPADVVGDLVLRMTKYGIYGVEMFFAITGFVIPYSMYLRGHTARQSGTFLLRRIARLEPPYLACIALIVCLNTITTWRVGSAALHPELQISAGQLLAHLGYLNAILGFRWLNVVFWTLAIEFQFYLACLIVFPLIFSKRMATRAVSLIAIAALGFLGTGVRDHNPPLLPYWLPLFAMGMTTCCAFTKQLNTLLSSTVMVTVVVVALVVNGAASTAFAAIPLTAIILMKTQQPWRLLQPLAWLGTISYSFYLLHLPIGQRMIGHLRKHLPANTTGDLMTLALIFTAVIGASYIFYRLIERPSQRSSQRIGRRHATLPGPTATASTPHSTLPPETIAPGRIVSLEENAGVA